METVEIITASGRAHDIAAKELKRDVNLYLEKMSEAGDRCLLSVNVIHSSVVHSAYSIEHFFCANIITAPIGSNTQFQF